MKRFPLAAAALALLGAGAGCTNLNEKLVTNVSSQYYGSAAGITAATNAMYSQLRNHWGREESMALSQLGTDTWFNGDQVASGAQAWSYLNDYSVGLNSQDARIGASWNAFYQMINTANTILDRGPAATGLDQATKNSRIGEAHFVRALAYFMLVQTWGDVTLNLHEVQGAVTTATRTPAADVYKVIIADLDTAATLLPAKQADFGRATLGAALHLRSKVYLTRGYKSYGAGTADFQQALADAKAVIASGSYALLPNYADLWCVARTADPNRQGYCEVNGLNEQNAEVIFPVQYSTNASQYTVGFGNYLHLVYIPHYDGNVLAQGLTRDVVNGRPFRRARPSPLAVALYDQVRWAGTPGQSDVKDTRWDGSYQTLWIANTAGLKNPAGTCPACTSGQTVNVGDTALWMPGYQVTNAFRQSKKYVVYTPCTTDPTADCGLDNRSRFTYGWELYPALKKFQDDARASVAEVDGGKDIYLMRLGETYLNAAEADVALGNPGEAASFVNVLRARAASPAHKTENGVTAAQMTLDFVMDERERELGGELNRWYDLVRPGAAYFVARVKKYNPYAAPNVDAHFALRPIPQSQLDLSTGGYPQNPGY